MSSLDHEVQLLIVQLAQFSDRETVLTRFVSTMNRLQAAYRLSYRPDGACQPSDVALPLTTARHAFGAIILSPGEHAPHDPRDQIENAVHLLAIVLENVHLRAHVQRSADLPKHEDCAALVLRYQQLYQAVACGILVHDAAGVVTHANQASATILGVPFDSLVGWSPSSTGWLAIDEQGRGMPADELPVCIAMRSGVTASRVFAIKMTQHARLRWVHATCVPVYNDAGELHEVLSTFVDITEQKEIEEEYRTLFETMLNGFARSEIICDDAGQPVDYRLLSVNPAFTRITGVPAAEAIGRTLTELFPDREPFWIDTFGRVALTGEPVQVEHYAAPLQKWLQVSAYSPHRGHFACLFADVTERKHYEEAIRKMTSELERRVRMRTRELLAANQELEAFSFSVSHDIRGPLRWLDGFAAKLDGECRHSLDSVGRAYVGMIRQTVEHINQLIGSLLHFSRVTRQEIESVPIDLTAFVEEICARLQDGDPRPVAWQVEPGLWLQGDAALLRVAFTNLLENAWKFTAKVDDPCVEVLRNPSNPDEIIVRDNGVGFDMARAGQLFHPFQRMHAASEYPGTGIGLSLVHRIITRHGGYIRADSRPDAGANFYVHIPEHQ